MPNYLAMEYASEARNANLLYTEAMIDLISDLLVQLYVKEPSNNHLLGIISKMVNDSFQYVDHPKRYAQILKTLLVKTGPVPPPHFKRTF